MSQVPMPEGDTSLYSVLTHQSDLSNQELQQKLQSIPGVEIDHRLPSENELSKYKRYSVSLPSSPDRLRSGIEVWGLEPATATVFLIGLGILLEYVTKKSSGGTPSQGGGSPPVIDNGGSGSEGLCKHLVDGEECGHPFKTPTTIRQGDTITVVKFCTRDPDPHPTLEHFRQKS